MPCRFALLAAVFIICLGAQSGARNIPLASADKLTLHNAVAEPVMFQGRKALKLTAAPGSGPAGPPSEQNRVDHMAILDGSGFSNGTIEVEIAGEPAPGATGQARGFVGIAFRVQPDRRTYDAFYLRPTNGHADDMERRNHTVQYISHPQHTWFRLREATPSRYEGWADIGPARWIHLRIEVDGNRARLFVNRALQPSLIVNDVKTGAEGKGAVALWFEGSTVAHFSNLKITPR